METNLAPRLDLAVVDTEEGAAAVTHPERRRLLQALAERPDSATGLAERLGDTRQRINYHLAALAEAGLVELAEERARRGFTEKIYRPVGRRFALDPGLLGPLDAGRSVSAEGDRWAAGYAIALASRTTREVAGLMDKASREERRLAVGSMDTTVRLGSPKATEAFIDEVARAIAEIAARHDDAGPGARPFRLTACCHPAPPASAPDEPDNQETQR
ncbi:MAG: winged helix-turn-helix domain-containing protein [Gemmatimonadales bacterium]|jgi:DNA-binding transcriptional ArsR family regulator